MKWKVACALLAIAAAVEGGLLIKDAINENREKAVATLATDTIVDDVPDDVAVELARRFRPVLRFDRNEPWRPLQIGHFFKESHAGPFHLHRLCDRSNPRHLRLAENCPVIGEIGRFEDRVSALSLRGVNLALDIAGSQANGSDYATSDDSCTAEPPLLDCNEGPRTAIYYRVQGAHGRYYIDYWWFFRFNDFPEFDEAQRCEEDFRPFCGDHEGDWEGVTVITSPEDPDEVGYVAYAAHNGTSRYTPSQLKLEGPDEATKTRPVVYVARGSHASYPQPCEGELPVVRCLQDEKVVGPLRLPEGEHDGTKPWGRNEGEDCADDEERPGNSECLQPLPPGILVEEKSWNAYAGLWGRACLGDATCPVMRGPLSPGQQKRYDSPWCAHDVSPDGQIAEQPTCDVLTPGAGAEARPGVATAADCQAWAGVSTAVLACDAATLAEVLASDEESDESGIAIEIKEPRRPVKRAEDSETAGVAQYLGKPLRAPSSVRITGRVSDIVIRARPPIGSGQKDLFEATFTGLAIGPEEQVTARIRERDGQLRVTLLLPNGEVLLPLGG
jgi:hypothetical protein